MIKNKKILLICKESFSFPLFFLAKKLLNRGNEVGALFVNPLESYYNKSLYNENTYYKFKEELKEVKLFGLKDFCENYNAVNDKPVFDKEYLLEIEKEYTNFKNLNLQITTSQYMTRQYHNRDFFIESTFNQNLNFVELSYKKVINIIESFKPDLIIDIEDGEFFRTVINEVSFKKQIPYITIDYPRFEGYKIPTYCLGVKTEDYLKEEYNRCLQMSKEELTDEYNYILDMKNKSSIMSKEFKNTITSQYKPNRILPTLKYLVGKIFYFWNVYITNGNIKKTQKENIFYANPIKHFLFYAKVEWKKQFLMRPNKYFEAPEENEDYVYMPLHLIPESTTFVKAPFYINELHIIEQVSKSLPIGWKLYVKEHQAMLGERSYDFYKRVKKFPNVKLVQLNYYKDPKPWIEKAKGVITITGTGAYESAMLGKKAIIFGDVPFNLIEGITKIRSYDELPKLFASFGTIDNMHSCAAYIAAIKSVGMEINHKYLMSEGERILKGENNTSVEYQNEIDKLEEFFDKAYERYCVLNKKQV